jgi:hypothetical protein
MKKIRVNAAAIVGDLRQRMGLKAILEKHGISYANMLKVRKLLVERQLAAPEEFDYLNLSEAASGHSVSAKEFLASFRSKPNDLHLMKRYNLTVKELQVIYDTLMLAGVLSEYEYHTRDVKAPELDEPTGLGGEASTEVTLLRNELEPRCVIPLRGGDIEPRKSFPKDSVPNKAISARGQTVRAQNQSQPGSDPEDALIPKHCPKCGLQSHPSSPDACIYCGVVFTKAKPDPRYEGVAIWDHDCGGRY